MVINILPLTIEKNRNLQRVMKIHGSGVPQVVLMDEKGEHRGVQGSYSWGEISVDYVMPSQRTDYTDTLPISRDATIAFKVEGHAYAGVFHVTVFSSEGIVLHEAVEKDMKVKLPVGKYFLNAKATWKGRGDVSNVFKVDII